MASLEQNSIFAGSGGVHLQSKQPGILLGDCKEASKIRNGTLSESSPLYRGTDIRRPLETGYWNAAAYHAVDVQYVGVSGGLRQFHA